MKALTILLKAPMFLSKNTNALGKRSLYTGYKKLKVLEIQKLHRSTRISMKWKLRITRMPKVLPRHQHAAAIRFLKKQWIFRFVYRLAALLILKQIGNVDLEWTIWIVTNMLWLKQTQWQCDNWQTNIANLPLQMIWNPLTNSEISIN